MKPPKIRGVRTTEPRDRGKTCRKPLDYSQVGLSVILQSVTRLEG